MELETIVEKAPVEQTLVVGRSYDLLEQLPYEGISITGREVFRDGTSIKYWM